MSSSSEFSNRLWAIKRNTWLQKLAIKEVWVCLAPANKSMIAQLVKDLAPEAFLFYAFPEKINEHEEACLYQIPGNYAVCSFADRALFARRLGDFLSFFPKPIKMSVAEEFQRKNADEVEAIRKSVELTQLNAKMDRRGRLIRLRNSIRNLPRIIDSTRSSNLSLNPSIPCVVCGAGPSLGDSISALKTIRDKCLIVAVGHAVKVLKHHEITPDCIAEIDYQAQVNWEDNPYPDSLLIASTDLSPQVSALFPKIHWIKGGSMEFNELAAIWDIPLDDIILSRTVTVSAIDFCVKNGAKEIVLIGNDLSLSATGEAHKGESKRSSSATNLIRLKGIDGRDVYTDEDLNAAKTALENHLRYVKQQFPEVKIYNCTRRGAVIANARQRSFDNFVDEISKRFSIAAPQKIYHEIGEKVKDVSPLIESLVKKVKRYSLVVKEAIEKTNDSGALEKLEAKLLKLQHDEMSKSFFEAISQHSLETICDTNVLGLDENIEDYLTKENYLWQKDLCEDFLEDLDKVTAMMNRALPFEWDLLYFNSFRKHAMRFFKKSNPSFAAELEKQRDHEERIFELKENHQFLPWVVMRAENGEKYRLNGLTMESDATAKIDRFLETRDYKENDVVVFQNPGNWIDVVKFAERFPSAKIMVYVEDPAMLAGIIEIAVFVNYLPHDLKVVSDKNDIPEHALIF